MELKMKTNEELIALGSQTARKGFRNEKDIVDKFNNWKCDEDAIHWLGIMGYKVDDIEKVEAVTLYGYKTDVQVKVTIYFKEAIDAQNISIKLVSNPQGFNQVDKRWVDNYVEMWGIPEDIINILKLFTGESEPNKTSRDARRLFLDEMDISSQDKIVKFFDDNKTLVVADILKGRGKFSANWMMVALVIDGKTQWALKDINYALNVFSKGETKITDRGSLKIGKITMQRKGGDNGRRSAQMLQFKINPVELFK